MRKVQWILGFFLFASQIWGQGFERSFKSSGMRSVADIDSIGPDIWRLSLDFYWSGSGPDYGYTSDAFFYPSSQVLGPLKIVSHSSFRNRVPVQYLTSSRAIHLRYYDSYPFINVSWFNLNDTSAQRGIDIPRMAVSLNWEFGQNDSIFGLFNRLDYQSYGREETEYFYLSLITKNSDKLQILDSFRLKADIYAPGTFLLDKDSRGFEYINDSLHYHYRRGQQEPDTFYVDTGAFYAGVKQVYSREKYISGNTKTYKYYRFGKFRREENPSGYKVYEVFLDGSEQLVRNVIYPHVNQPILNRSNWYPPNYRNYEQGEGINCIVYRSPEQDSLYLLRTSNNQIQKTRLFVRKPNSDFQLAKAYSFADGAFLLMGSINNRVIMGCGGSSSAYLIYIDSKGKTTVLLDDQVFSIHLERITNRLKIFYENSSAELRYRIVDASGRRMQEGEFQAYEGISLGDWKTGIYYLQLWTEQSTYLGQQAFLISHP